MPAIQQWGRKESIIWPPRGFPYTLGALFLSLVATGFFMYIRFQYGLLPLQRYYLPYYLRSKTAGLTHPASSYQMIYISDGKSRSRAALEDDVAEGTTPQISGTPLPLVLVPGTRQQGFRYLFREPLRSYPNKTLHTWIAHAIYEDVPLHKLFSMQLLFGLLAFAIQLPFSLRKDIERIKALRYGRRLKGPVL